MTARCPGWLRLSADRTRYEIAPDRAEIVRSIFSDYAAGVGMYYDRAATEPSRHSGLRGQERLAPVGRKEDPRQPSGDRRVPAPRQARRSARPRGRADRRLLSRRWSTRPSFIASGSQARAGKREGPRGGPEGADLREPLHQARAVRLLPVPDGVREQGPREPRAAPTSSATARGGGAGVLPRGGHTGTSRPPSSPSSRSWTWKP